MKLKFLPIFVLLFVIGVSAQSPSKILNQANKALGGEKVLKNITSKYLRGKITRKSDSASGNYILQTAKPNLYAESFDLNGFEFASGFSGRSGWRRDSREGLQTLTGNAAQEFLAENIFRNNLWLTAKAEKTAILSGGATTVNSKAANVILLKPAKSSQIKLYFDKATNLLIREEFPQSGAVKIIDYEDYRDVGGVRQPFLITFKNADDSYEVKIEEAKFNQAIAKSNFDFPRISNEPLPDIKTLLDEIRANAEKIDELLEKYSFTETRVSRDLDKNGNLIEKGSETISLSFYKGYRINRLVAKNGKPLSEREQSQEDRDVEKQIKEIEERIKKRDEKNLREQRDSAQTKQGAPDGDRNQRISLSDALRGSNLVNPRRERLGGREVIVFDYEPNPSFKPQSNIEKLFALCTGAVWVDAEDKQVVRLDAFLTKSAGNFIGKVKRGASFSLENKRVNNEIWLPAIADINLSVKILFAGININRLVSYSDYKRFDTEVKEGKVNELKP